MKKHIKSIAGVTLLEIMVIVMSIRYYQNATNSQNTNTILEEIQNITAAADNLSQGSSSYSSISTSSLAPVAGSANMKDPYGAPITISGTSTGSTYTVSIPSLPAAVCTQLISKLKANSKFVTPSCSATTGVVTATYTYNASS
jgi:hypothetical protein